MSVEKNGRSFHEFPRFSSHTVKFAEESKEEIENSQIESSSNDEREYLCANLPKKNGVNGNYGDFPSRLRSRPRMASVFHMVDSPFAGGIVTRANYMARCYRTAWEVNHATDTQCLHFLLWNGESSQSPSWQAITVLILQWIFPFIPVVLAPSPIRESDVFRGLAWILFVLEILVLVWYCYVLFVLVRNRRLWKQSWFTFEVRKGTIGLVDSGQSHELTLFHFSANFRFVKTTLDTISRLHTISKHEQGILEEDMRRRDLNDCEIILYTGDFLSCYSSWPKYMTMGLVFCEVLSVIFMMVLLAFG